MLDDRKPKQQRIDPSQVATDQSVSVASKTRQAELARRFGLGVFKFLEVSEFAALNRASKSFSAVCNDPDKRRSYFKQQYDDHRLFKSCPVPEDFAPERFIQEFYAGLIKPFLALKQTQCDLELSTKYEKLCQEFYKRFIAPPAPGRSVKLASDAVAPVILQHFNTLVKLALECVDDKKDRSELLITLFNNGAPINASILSSVVDNLREFIWKIPMTFIYGQDYDGIFALVHRDVSFFQKLKINNWCIQGVDHDSKQSIRVSLKGLAEANGHLPAFEKLSSLLNGPQEEKALEISSAPKKGF